MTHDLPAMRRLKSYLPFFALADDAKWAPAAAQRVADVEAEGNALIGAVPCPGPHGHETLDGSIAVQVRMDSKAGAFVPLACSTCGAV